VGLQADAVNFDPTSFETRNDAFGGCPFVTAILKVIIVVIEFNIWVVLCCCGKSNGDKFCANIVVER